MILKRFIEKNKANFDFSGYTINKIHYFGERIGFIDLTGDIKDKEGNPLPAISFLRGDSVAMLTILVSEETQKEYFVLTYQPRVPVGQYIYEIPAGMLDGKEVVSQAIAELEEEIGTELEVSTDDLVLIEEGYNSPGILDEKTFIYAFKKILPQKTIDLLQNRKSGLEEEQIITVLVEEKDFLNIVDSIPSKLAFYAYKSVYK